MAKLYCDKDLQDEFFMIEEESTLFKITDEFYDVVLNIEDEEIITLVQENPIAKYFLKRDTASIYGNIEDFIKIKNGDFLNFSNDILILNDENNVEQIRKTTGVLALKIDAPFLEDQKYRFGFTINKDRACKFKSWSDVVKEKPFVPINSAIITDNFLWSKKGDFHDDNLENLYRIITDLVPEDLLVPFNLLINIDFRYTGLTKKQGTEKINKVKKNLEKLTGKEFLVGISSHTNPSLFHSRVILTNHHFLLVIKVLQYLRIVEQTLRLLVIVTGIILT